MRKTFQLAAAIAVCQSAGIFGLIFTAPAIPVWYAQLSKPALTTPGWVFGPIWITLYTLMGIALYLVWQKRTKEQCNCTALQLFFFQLALHALWTYLFFGLKEPLLALIEIVILFLAVSVVMWQFWKISKPAAYVLLPYAVWIVFAAYLNFAIWQLN